MKNNFKKLISVILCAVLIFTTASTAFAADEPRVIVDSGYCGAQVENLTWTLYSDGELVISGKGEMDWYYVDCFNDSSVVEHRPPWYGYYRQIDVVTLEEGVESIGNDAFSGNYIGYYKVNIPKTLRFYENHPFRVNVNTCKDGQCCVLSYAGTKEEWANVEHREYSYSVKADKSECVRKYTGLTNDSFNYLIYSRYRYFKVCFNSTEPEAFIQLVGIALDNPKLYDMDDSKEFSVYYYAKGLEDIEICWTVEGDAINQKCKEDSTSGLLTVGIYTPNKYGTSVVKVELWDSDGNILSSDSTEVFSYVKEGRSFSQLLKYYYEEAMLRLGVIGVGVAFYFEFVISALFGVPIEFIKDIFG